MEATMIIVDNSESSRNGDYVPSRWEAQADAVNMIFQAKTQANAESSVGLISMGGKGPELLVTLTTDFGKILEGMHRTKIQGSTHLATGIQIAGLALKHRKEKAHKQRIIVFSCSPIHDEKEKLIQLAKRMKKNNVSIDFVAFGDLDPSNTKKLEAFSEAAKSASGDGSHLAIIPPGPSLLSDHLISTSIITSRGGDDGIGGTGDTAGGQFNEFDIDPNTDPELALALRMSMEEEKARQEKAKGEAAKESGLEGIPEESGETQPLLGENSEPDGSGSGSGSTAKEKKDKDKDDGGDEMDIA